MALPRLLKRVIWVIATIIGLFAVAVLVLSLKFVFLMGSEPSKDEVARVCSPSVKLDAVLIETNGGATTSFGYQIYVVEHGAQPSGAPSAFLYGAVRNQHAYGANLRWANDSSLVIEYLTAKSKKINKSVLSVGGQSVQIALQDGVSDPSAPSGGMLYNMRGRQIGQMQQKER